MACVKICITGPESTGKSTLTKQLSAHFKFPFVEEKAREYLNKLSGKHNLEDLEKIARLQLEAMNTEASKNQVLFCDTDVLTLKIWAQDKFDQEIQFVEENYQKHSADLYLLCYPDLDWQPDPLREDQHRLMEIYLFYIGLLEFMDANYTVIKGKDEDRLDNAKEAVSDFLLKEC